MGKWIVLLFLVWGAAWDLKCKHVPKTYLYIFSVAAVAYLLGDFIYSKDILEILAGIVPGCVGLFFAFISREQIGYGDGIVVLLAGLFLSAKAVITIVFFAFIFVTILSILLLVTHNAGRKSKIPLIPFLLAGQIVCICGGYI